MKSQTFLVILSIIPPYSRIKSLIEFEVIYLSVRRTSIDNYNFSCRRDFPFSSGATWKYNRIKNHKSPTARCRRKKEVKKNTVLIPAAIYLVRLFIFSHRERYLIYQARPINHWSTAISWAVRGINQAPTREHPLDPIQRALRARVPRARATSDHGHVSSDTDKYEIYDTSEWINFSLRIYSCLSRMHIVLRGGGRGGPSRESITGSHSIKGGGMHACITASPRFVC